MHALFFSAKRAHQRTLASLREVIKLFKGDDRGLTPARFDMLYAIHANANRREPVYQVSLCKILGVTDATVSRMVRSLEELGYLSRTRSTVDRRRLDIRLTEAGVALFELAKRFSLDSGIVDGIVRYSISTQVFGAPDDAVKKPFFDLSRLLHRMRRRFHDVARDLYPLVYPRARARFDYPTLSS